MASLTPTVPQEGLDALRILAEKWPVKHALAISSDPLWKSSVALASPQWADFAATTMAFLELSASSLVDANISLPVDNSSARYKILAEKLGALLQESNSGKATSKLLDNWHILRRPHIEPPATRLKQIIEEKEELDRVSRGRLRGLHDATELRDHARAAAAVLLDHHEDINKLLLAASAEQERVLSADASVSKTQAASRNLRAMERARAAIDAIAYRLEHEFSTTAATGIEELDAALHQEDMMHAHLDGVIAKISSTLATSQVKQLAQQETAKSLAVSAAQVEKPGILGRVFNREAIRLGVSPQSAKTLRQLASGSLSEKNWPSILALLSDPGMAPDTPMGGTFLLRAVMESQIPFPSRTELTDFVLLLSAADGGRCLIDKVPPETVENFCLSLLNEEREEYDPEDDYWWGDIEELAFKLTGQSEKPAIAAEIWLRAKMPQRRGFGASIRLARAIEKLSPDAPSKAIPAWVDVVRAAIEENERFFVSGVMDNKESRDFLVRAVASIKPEKSSDLVYSLLCASLRSEAEGPNEQLKERLWSLSSEQVNALAKVILIAKRKSPQWLELFGSLPGKSLEESHSPDDYRFIPVDPPHAFHGTDIQALRAYREMVVDRRNLPSWPLPLARAAFQSGSLEWLHELVEVAPQMPISWKPSPVDNFNPLAAVMAADFDFKDNTKFKKKVVSRSPSQTATTPSVWCEKLDAWKDVSATSVSSVGSSTILSSFPRTTPLMVAAKKNSHPWLRALLDAGADPDVADENNRTAMDYWIRTQLAEFEKSSKLEQAKKSSQVFLLCQMDALGWWGVGKIPTANTSPKRLLTSLAIVEIQHAQPDPELARRRHQVVRGLLSKASVEVVEQALIEAIGACEIAPDHAGVATFLRIAEEANAPGHAPTLQTIKDRFEILGKTKQSLERAIDMEKLKEFERSISYKNAQIQKELINSMYSKTSQGHVKRRKL